MSCLHSFNFTKTIKLLHIYWSFNVVTPHQLGHSLEFRKNLQAYKSCVVWSHCTNYTVALQKVLNSLVCCFLHYVWLLSVPVHLYFSASILSDVYQSLFCFLLCLFFTIHSSPLHPVPIPTPHLSKKPTTHPPTSMQSP
jgi:hypothetical protein